jgi:NADP-dependent 3-hydroxy acid dehydrogenase YdfG
MKVVITGHTSGLGKAIFDHMTTKSHEVIGLSRSNGFEFPQRINDAVKIAQEADLFINNAHVNITQAIFLKMLSNKVDIITSGSMGADYAFLGNAYYQDKKAIQEAHKSCRRTSKYNMLLLKMGYLENHTDKINTIKYSQVLSAIDFWLENPRITLIEFDNIK